MAGKKETNKFHQMLNQGIESIISGRAATSYALVFDVKSTGNANNIILLDDKNEIHTTLNHDKSTKVADLQSRFIYFS